MSNVKFTRWDSDKILTEISGITAENMLIATKLVQQDAEANAPRESGKLASDVAVESQVTARGNTIEGRVGIPRGRGHAFYGLFSEVGTSTLPARPWLRPALFNNKAKILKILRGGG